MLTPCSNHATSVTGMYIAVYQSYALIISVYYIFYIQSYVYNSLTYYYTIEETCILQGDTGVMYKQAGVTFRIIPVTTSPVLNLLFSRSFISVLKIMYYFQDRIQDKYKCPGSKGKCVNYRKYIDRERERKSFHPKSKI